MIRLRTLRLFTILAAACSTFLILHISLPIQPAFLSSETSNLNFINTPFYHKLWRLPNVLYSTPSSDEESATDYVKEQFFKVIKKNPIKTKTYPVIGRYSYDEKLRTSPWFMEGGKTRPKHCGVNDTPILFPEQDSGDRIIEQLMFVPEDFSDESSYRFSLRRRIFLPVRKIQLKTILLYFGANGWYDLPLGREVFLRDKCPVNTCIIDETLKYAKNSDAIIFKRRFVKPNFRRNHNQVWILYLLENPLHTPSFTNIKFVINWTATYRQDSDLVTPYEKFVPYNVSSINSSVGDTASSENRNNYSFRKTKLVAWFVSNCHATNSRLQYAYMLSHFIDVDIYGTCGRKLCPREMNSQCMKMLDEEYKFYLAFENGNCKDYITEKFFINGLSHNIIPIVMGARREDYSRVAPPHSYIHVDDFASPKDLATYLKILDANDTLYNEYFSWKSSGEFINTFFWCRLCALLHAPYEHKSYADINDWWNKPGTCDAKTRRKR